MVQAEPAVSLPKVFADFHNADPRGRVRLNCRGTLEDLEAKRIKLREGVVLMLSDDDELRTKGTVTWSEEEGIWAAVIDWDAIERIAES